ncbi:MAG TPA: ABC transporter ATP-binding protein [Egibacteraceae bacterium]|nr:ABC transporter ATP-binding protein [Egibacteraceae bacterium]
MSVVVIEQLRKSYGDTVAVDGLDLTIEQGEVLALLGPNGAGKTTTVEILEGHRRRTSGNVSVLGFDPETGGRAFRERIGIVLQEAGFDEDFSVAELCALHRGMYPRRRDVDEVIALVGLTEKRDARVKTLSGGQRRRLDLALGLVGDPDLMFLDEPTTGFDPSARRNAWSVIEGLRALGKTILLTTHYMDEAQHLADRVAVIVRGRLVALDTPEALRRRAAGSVISLSVPPGVTPPALDGHTPRPGERLEVASDDPTRDLQRLTAWAAEHHVDLSSLTVSRPTLDDIYLQLTRDQAGPR